MRVVSLRLRLLAAFVDAATVGSGMAACIGAVTAGVVGYSRRRGDKGPAYGEAEGGQHDDGQGESDAIEDDAPSRVDRATRGSRPSPELQVALRGASAGLAIASRNWRSPGFRLIGLRRVDAHTGGGVTVRSALAGVLFDEAWQAAWRPLFRSRAKRRQTRLRALAPQLRAIERNNRGDPQARSRALTEFYQSNPVSPAGGCGWLAAGPLASQLALALSSRSRPDAGVRVGNISEKSTDFMSALRDDERSVICSEHLENHWAHALLGIASRPATTVHRVLA